MKNPAAVALGRLGGLARARKLLAKDRVEIARKAGSTPKKKRCVPAESTPTTEK
jgi:hypothetical protein